MTIVVISDQLRSIYASSGQYSKIKIAVDTYESKTGADCSSFKVITDFTGIFFEFEGGVVFIFED